MGVKLNYSPSRSQDLVLHNDVWLHFKACKFKGKVSHLSLGSGYNLCISRGWIAVSGDFHFSLRVVPKVNTFMR
jgi:hypothetical protein